MSAKASHCRRYHAFAFGVGLIAFGVASIFYLLSNIPTVHQIHISSRFVATAGPHIQKQQQQQRNNNDVVLQQFWQQSRAHAAGSWRPANNSIASSQQQISRRQFMRSCCPNPAPSLPQHKDLNVPRAVQFERTQPAAHPKGSYHATLHVFISQTVIAPTTADRAAFLAGIQHMNAALAAHSPSWVQFAKGSGDYADVVLQHAVGCGDVGMQLDAVTSTSVPTVLVQHSLQGCITGSSSPSSTAAFVSGSNSSISSAVASWARVLLVVSPFNLELHVQSLAPGLQDQMRLWSMPGGADQQQLLPAGKADNATVLAQKQIWSILGPGVNTTGRLVVSYGSLPAADLESLHALLQAAAATQHILLFFGPSQPLMQLCGSQAGATGSATARAPAAGMALTPASCKHLRHIESFDHLVLHEALRLARYVVLLHSLEAWQDGAADAVLLGKRLLLYNRTAPHQPYRWLRPYATLVEPGTTQQVSEQLKTALAQDPPGYKPYQQQAVPGVFGWHSLAPQLADRVWTELTLSRLPSAAQQPSTFLQPEMQAPADHAILQRRIQALVHVCAQGNDTVLSWVDGNSSVLEQRPQEYLADLSSPQQCPPILLVHSYFDRSLGMCQDVSQLAAYLDVPILPAAILHKHMPTNTSGVEARTSYHLFCKCSAIFVPWFAYGEVLNVLKNDTDINHPLHKYWFMLNHDVMGFNSPHTTMPFTQVADRLLCKTRACQQLLQAWLQHNRHSLPQGEHDVMFTSFSTPDPSAGPLSEGINMDFTQFLHAMGKSPWKNTQAIMDAWARNPDFPALTITTYEAKTVEHIGYYLSNRKGYGYTPLNMRLVSNLMSVQQLNDLTSSLGNHLCPSEKEGFGHYINQARAAGALLLTTDYPPMREFAGDNEEYGVLCPYSSLSDGKADMLSAIFNPYLPHMSARLSPDNIAACVRKVLAMSVPARKQRAAAGRQRFLQELHFFRGVLQQLKQEAQEHVQQHQCH